MRLKFLIINYLCFNGDGIKKGGNFRFNKKGR